MLTIILIILLILLITGLRFGPVDSRQTLVTVLIILLIVWLLFAFGLVGDYGYWPRRVP